MLDQDENFYPTSMSILITCLLDNICYREKLQFNHHWELRGSAKISCVKISGPFLKVKSIILLFPCCVKRIHISLLSHFILQLGQTSKAFEHLGNALTYDPSNVKVRFWHSLPSLCTMYVELIFFLLAQSFKLNTPQESVIAKCYMCTF